MSLKFIGTEKHMHDTIVFPAFDLTITAGEVAAICSNVNVREQLIDILLGKKILSNGQSFHYKKSQILCKLMKKF